MCSASLSSLCVWFPEHMWSPLLPMLLPQSAARKGMPKRNRIAKIEKHTVSLQVHDIITGPKTPLRRGVRSARGREGTGHTQQLQRCIPSTPTREVCIRDPALTVLTKPASS